MPHPFLVDILKLNGNTISGNSGGVSVNGAILPQMYFGSGSPEGVVQSLTKNMYFDEFGDKLWLKKVSSGITGWLQLI